MLLTIVPLFRSGTASALTHAQRAVKHEIRAVFPVRYKQAQRVAYCESRYHRKSQNGQFKGVFQLSQAWRSYFRRLHPRWHDVAFSASENITAAQAIHKGEGWQPWSCGYLAYDPNAPR